MGYDDYSVGLVCSDEVVGNTSLSIADAWKTSLSCSADSRLRRTERMGGMHNTPTEMFPTVPGGKYAGQGKVTCRSTAQSASIYTRYRTRSPSPDEYYLQVHCTLKTSH